MKIIRPNTPPSAKKISTPRPKQIEWTGDTTQATHIIDAMPKNIPKPYQREIQHASQPVHVKQPQEIGRENTRQTPFIIDKENNQIIGPAVIQGQKTIQIAVNGKIINAQVTYINGHPTVVANGNAIPIRTIGSHHTTTEIDKVFHDIFGSSPNNNHGHQHQFDSYGMPLQRRAPPINFTTSGGPNAKMMDMMKGLPEPLPPDIVDANPTFHQ